VHLPGETDAGDCVAANSRGGERARDGQAAGAPPIARVLLGPAGARRCEGRVFFEAGAGDAAFFVDDQGARAAGAYVDAKNVNGRAS